MTQLTISDELASAIASKAADWTCSTEDLLESMLFRLETDEAFSGRLLTPALGSRIRADLARVDRGEYLTEEQVDGKFDEMFHELESR